MLDIIFILSCSVGVVVSLSARDKYGFLLNHYTVMNLWWHVLLFLFRLYQFYDVNNQTILIFLLGLFVFNLTVVFVPNDNKKTNKSRHLFYINLRKRRIIEIIIFLLLIPYIKAFYSYITSGMELWYLREFVSGEGKRTYGFGAILEYFITPMSISLLMTSYYKYNFKEKKFSAIISFSLSLIIVIILGLIEGGGRSLVINWLMFYFLIIFMYSSKDYNIFNRNGKFNIILISIPLTVIIIMTLFRGIFVFFGESSIIALTIRSYTLFPGLFNYYLSHPSESGFTSNTFGVSTFENIFLLIQYPFNLISGRSVSNQTAYILNYKLVDSIIQINRDINLNHSFNAQVSMYFRFFRDWGYLGVLIGPLILSFFFNQLYRYAAKNKINMFFYLYSIMLIHKTTSDLPYSKTNYLLIFLCFLFFKKLVLSGRKVFAAGYGSI